MGWSAGLRLLVWLVMGSITALRKPDKHPAQMQWFWLDMVRIFPGDDMGIVASRHQMCGGLYKRSSDSTQRKAKDGKHSHSRGCWV